MKNVSLDFFYLFPYRLICFRQGCRQRAQGGIEFIEITVGFNPEVGLAYSLTRKEAGFTAISCSC